MRYLSLAEVLYLHRRILESSSGGGAGIRDLPMARVSAGAAEADVGGSDLYPSLVEKAAALCFSMVNITRSWTATSGWRMRGWKVFCC